MKKLNNFHKSYFDCFEDCVSSVIDYYQKDYEYLFAEAWRVNLNAGSISNPITDLLSFCNTCRIVDKNCGLKSEIKNFYKYEYLEEYLIQSIRTDRPVVISVDMFRMPWSEYYQKVHSAHFVIVFEYLKDHCFHIFDVTKQIDSIELDVRCIFDEKNCTVVLSETEEYQVPDIEEIMNTSKQIIKQDVEINSGYEALFEIAEHYFREDTALFGLASEDVEAEPFIKRLLYFGRQRLSFAEFLKYASIKTGDMSYQNLITGLGDLGAKWLTFRNRLMKMRLKGTFFEKKEELRERWIFLAGRDKALYESFIYGSNEEKAASGRTIDLELLTPAAIEISGQFNSNAFNSNRWNNPLGFDLNGYFYELEKKDINYKAENCDLKFRIDQQYDNISCLRQVIPVMQKAVRAVMVIGSCENGDYSEDLLFTYENREELISLTYPDWWECGRFQEKTVKKLNCLKMAENQIQIMGEVHIFSQLLLLDNENDHMLYSIRLPDCSNIHIFELLVYT